MKAAQINEYGHADAVNVQEVDKPSINKDQVLVEVQAASLNPFDTMVREGYLQEMVPLKLPVTLGGDIAGVVREVGEDVENINVNDIVYGQANVVAIHRQACQRSGPANRPGQRDVRCPGIN